MKKISFLLAGSLFIASCSSFRQSSTKTTDDGRIDVTYMLINDVYEIAPLEGGKTGGMARVATLKKSYLKANPNTYLMIAGDFLSPSVYNSLQYEGKRIRGKQMIESMNSAKVDFAIFGNHEFDINENELQDRLNESNFQWVSSNTFHKKSSGVVPFSKTTSGGSESFPETYIHTITDADGTTVKVGYIGLTLPFNKADYVTYVDPLAVAETLYSRIKDSCDAIVAMTHQDMDDDIRLAQKLPGLAMILGGHEHDMRFQKVGNVYIAKAHANARSAYIVDLTIDRKKRTFDVKPKLKMINESVAIDSATDAVVQKWMEIGNKNYSSLGFDPKKIVLREGEPLDGREASIRTKTTNFTKMIVSAMEEASPDADAVFINAGSIRVDDLLSMPVTQYDIIRSLPFGGQILEVDMKGSLLVKVLNAGRSNVGVGGFLHYSQNIAFDGNTNTWFLRNTQIDEEKIYKIAMTDFLMTGGEANMGFLTKANPDILRVYPAPSGAADPKSDVRLAIVKYLERIG